MGLEQVENKQLSGAPIDRRRFSRVALVNLPAEYRLDGWLQRWQRGTALELSSNGIKLMVPHLVKKGSRVQIRLQLANMKKPVLIKVRVAWHAPSDIKPNFEFGAEFVSDYKVDARDRVTQFVAERLCKSIDWLGSGISVRTVESYEESLTVFRLIYHEYLKRAYCKANSRELFFCSQSLLPSSEMFIVKRDNDFLGSLSLMGDSPAGLPAEHLYPDEVKSLRGEGRRLAEVGLLALKLDAFQKTFSMGNLEKMRSLFHLFKIMFDYARYTLKATDLIIHMNPRHRLLYEFLTFEAIGPVRYYSDFQNKPAILMRMDVAKTNREHSTPDARCSHFVMNSLPADLLRKRFHWSSEHIRTLVKDSGMWEHLRPEVRAHFSAYYPEL